MDLIRMLHSLEFVHREARKFVMLPWNLLTFNLWQEGELAFVDCEVLEAHVHPIWLFL